MNKEEMTKIVNAYAKAKHEEKTLKASIAQMADAIKDYFGKRRCVPFERGFGSECYGRAYKYGRFYDKRRCAWGRS